MHQLKRPLDEPCLSPQPLKFFKPSIEDEQEEEVVDLVPYSTVRSPCKQQQQHCLLKEDLETRENSSSQDSGLDVQECASSPAPRVWEIVLPPVRRPVRIDSSCQAEVPPWDPCVEVDEDRLYMGRRVWPPQSEEQLSYQHPDRKYVEKDRQLICECLDGGSVECVKLHVEEERRRLAAELGPAFRWLGFEEMGDCVSELWTEEEQRTFKELVMMNPASQHRNFWANLRVAFPARSSKELVSYYFNVFMLRRRAQQNRFYPQDIDSDFDEGDLSDTDDDMEFTDSDEEERVCLQHELQQQHLLSRDLQHDQEQEQDQDLFEEEEEDEISDSDGEGGKLVACREICRRQEEDEEEVELGEEEDEESKQKRLSFAGTEAEIMRLAALGGAESWLSSSALELSSTNGAMQEIFGGHL